MSSLTIVRVEKVSLRCRFEDCGAIAGVEEPEPLPPVYGGMAGLKVVFLPFFLSEGVME